MPNQRKKNLRMVSAWIDAETKTRLEALAKANGVTLSDLIVGKLEDYFADESKTDGKRSPTKT